MLKVESKVKDLLESESGDVKTGVAIVLRALEEPIRQIAANAGIEGSIIVEKVRENKCESFGYDAYNDKFVDMIDAGILDPTKLRALHCRMRHPLLPCCSPQRAS